MDAPCRFFMVGSSIFILALEAALSVRPNVILARAQPYQIRRLTGALNPALVAVIYDHDRLGPRLLRHLAGAGFILVSLDARTGVGTCVDGRQAAITSIEDLMTLLKFCRIQIPADYPNRDL